MSLGVIQNHRRPVPSYPLPVIEARLLSYAWMQLWDPAAYLGLAEFEESHSETSHPVFPPAPQWCMSCSQHGYAAFHQRSLLFIFRSDELQ